MYKQLAAFMVALVSLAGAFGVMATINAKMTTDSAVAIISYEDPTIEAKQMKDKAVYDAETDSQLLSLANAWEDGKGTPYNFDYTKHMKPSKKKYLEALGWYDRIEEATTQAKDKRAEERKVDAYMEAKDQSSQLCEIVKTGDTQKLNPYDDIWENQHNLLLALDYCETPEAVKTSILSQVKELQEYRKAS